MEDLDDNETEDAQPVFFKRKSAWLLVGAVFEFLSDIFMAFHKLTGVTMDVALQNYNFVNEQRRFAVQAALDIEELTGDPNATSKPSSSG